MRRAVIVRPFVQPLCSLMKSCRAWASRALRWSLLTGWVVVVVLWILSGWFGYELEFRSRNGASRSVSVGQGFLEVLSIEPQQPVSESGGVQWKCFDPTLSVGRATGRWGWWFKVDSWNWQDSQQATGRTDQLLVPLWCFFLLVGAATGLLWSRRCLGGRSTFGCPNCGYSRAGLAPGSPCPECGMARKSG
jgi:hypothetical protein